MTGPTDTPAPDPGVVPATTVPELVDVLLEYVTAAACACNTTEQRTHQRGDQGFCRLDRVSRSESED
jgi:hypothetical protein